MSDLRDLVDPFYKFIGIGPRGWRGLDPHVRERVMAEAGLARLTSKSWLDDTVFPRWMVDTGWPPHSSWGYDSHGRKLDQAPEDALFPPQPGWGSQCQVTTKAALAMSSARECIHNALPNERLVQACDVFFRRRQGAHLARPRFRAALEAAYALGASPMELLRLIVLESRPRASDQVLFVGWVKQRLAAADARREKLEA